MIEKIILKKSAVENKMPATEQLEYGEIALNFNAMNPFISFKDTADGIRQIRDYSNEIQNINGSLTDAKNEINVLRTDIDKNTQEITKCLKITDFNAFKEDNTNTFDAFALEVAKVLETKAEKTELNAYAKLTDATQTILANKLKADDLILEGFSLNDQINVINNNINRNTDYISNVELQKVNKTDIAQTTGTSTTSVMSQKASTMAFAANTPSGDPMHNMYVAMGAVWNGSGVDKTYPTPWADYAEDEEDKVYVHKNGCWAYCYVGDLTSKDMADIAILPKIYHAFPPFFACNFNGRAYASNISMAATGNLKHYTNGYTSGFETFFQNFLNEVIVLHDNPFDIDYAFEDNIYTFANTALRCIFGLMQLKGEDNNAFTGCKSLKFVFLYKLGINVSFKDCPKLSKHCVRYMIENALDATITITLHPEAYERAIADAGVQTALANKTNVSLVKAE